MDADRPLASCESALWFDNIDAGASPVCSGALTASVVETADAVFTDTEQKKGALWLSSAGTGMSRCKRSATRRRRFPKVLGDFRIPDDSCPTGGTTPSVAWRSGTRATSLIDWHVGSRLPSMSGRRACQSLRLGSGTRRHHKERSPSSPGLTIRPRTMMTAGRRRHTDWTRSNVCVLCCGPAALISAGWPIVFLRHPVCPDCGRTCRAADGRPFGRLREEDNQ